MNDPDIGEAAIRDEKIDAVVLGRPALADPEYPNKVLTGHTEKIRPCIACNQGCITRLQRGKQPTCAVNPTAMREIRFALKPCVRPKKVVIAGGGAAGMEAARTAALRGHQVTLIEKNAKLGGCMIQAGSHSFKKEVADLNRWYQQELKGLSVDIHTGTEATPDMVKSLEADVVILSTGYVPVMPKVPGIENPMAIECMDAYAHPEKIGQNVVVVGGGLVGCEMALGYAMEGKQVTAVEALDTLMTAGEEAPPIPNGQMIPDLFDHCGVKVLTRHKLTAVGDGTVTLASEEGEKTILADTAVIAVGFRPAPSMAAELMDSGAVVYEITGQNIGTILRAIWSGYELGNNI